MADISKPATRRAYLLATLLGVHVVALVVAYCFRSVVRRIGVEPQSIFLANVIAEAGVFSLWLATLPAWLRVRLPWVILLMHEIPCLLTTTRDSQLETFTAVAIISMVPLAVISLPLALLRRSRNLTLGHPDESESSLRRPIQFGIGELLLWTAAIACVLGVSRLAPAGGLRIQVPTVGMIVFACAFFCTQTAAAWPFICGVLWPGRCWLGIGLGVVGLGLLTLAQWQAGLLIGGPVYSPFPLVATAWANAAFGVWLLANLFIFRLFEFRLRHSEFPAGPSSFTHS